MDGVRVAWIRRAGEVAFTRYRRGVQEPCSAGRYGCLLALFMRILQAGSRLLAPTADNRLPVDGAGFSDW